MYYEQLQSKLHAVVPYPSQLSQMISFGIHHWYGFCALPQEAKDILAGSSKDGADEGYFRRTRASGREDKEYFHFSSETYLWAITEIRKAKDTGIWSVLESFLWFAKNLHKELNDFTTHVVLDFEQYAPRVVDAVYRPGGRRVIRFLHYNPQDENDMILGDQHFDRGGFTFHLFESHPGLEYLDFNYVWRPAPLQDGQTVVFTGYQLENFTNSDVQKTWHRVVRRKDLLGDEDRYSAVMFVDLGEQYRWDESRRTQDETPSYVLR